MAARRAAILYGNLDAERKEQVQLYTLIKGLPAAAFCLLPDGVRFLGTAGDLWHQEVTGKGTMHSLKVRIGQTGAALYAIFGLQHWIPISLCTAVCYRFWTGGASA